MFLTLEISWLPPKSHSHFATSRPGFSKSLKSRISNKMSWRNLCCWQHKHGTTWGNLVHRVQWPLLAFSSKNISMLKQGSDPWCNLPLRFPSLFSWVILVLIFCRYPSPGPGVTGQNAQHSVDILTGSRSVTPRSIYAAILTLLFEWTGLSQWEDCNDGHGPIRGRHLQTSRMYTLCLLTWPAHTLGNQNFCKETSMLTLIICRQI